MLIYRVSVVVAEWLRRLTRNQMGFTRTGSNPVHDEIFFTFILTSDCNPLTDFAIAIPLL